jgi:hypothetical protein
MAVLLREDDTTLQRRVCENDRSAKTYADAVSWLQRESIYLRKVSRLLDTAAGRISVVLERCQGGHSPNPNTSAGEGVNQATVGWLPCAWLCPQE